MSDPGRRKRLIFDVTGIACWIGTPVGILRAEHEFARHALSARPDIVLAFYDRAFGFRPLRPEWAATAIGWQGIIDPFPLVPAPNGRKGWRRFLPSRYPAIMALERRRLAATSPALRRLWAALQRLVLLGRVTPPFADAEGRRIDVVPLDLALDAPLQLGPDDVLVMAGMDWLRRDPDEIAALKRQTGFRCVALCYDLIPIFHPGFFAAHHVDEFRRYWTRMLALAERIVVTAQCVADDVGRHCAASGLLAPALDVVPLGYRPPDRGGPQAGLPVPLEPDKYALFVSTIEPRKGHALLLRVWQRLLAEGLPQRHRFRLVFVGRRGWMVDKVLAEIESLSRKGAMLLHFADLGDDAVAALYAGAAFCLYPSCYEGFGLPVLEAFAYGKAVLASTGGAVPETVAGRSPCLDPTDEAAWYGALRQWIEEPGARAPYERQIRASFRAPSWDEAAAQFFAAAAKVTTT